MQKNPIIQAAKKHPQAIMQPFDALADLQGIDAIVTLCDLMGGATVYMPSARRIFEGCVALEMRAEFTGYNYRSLAKKYGYSERHVRRLLQS